MATKQVSDFPQITSIDGEDLLHVKTAGGVDNKIKVKDFILDEKLPRHFDTIALAKAEDDLQAGDYVRTGGYYSANDGGGALYRVVAAATGTDDGGSYHDMSNGNQLELIVEGLVNAKTFGVVADTDGTAGNGTDNFQAIENLIAYCGAVTNKPKTIFFPEGWYRTTGTHTFGYSQATIEGENHRVILWCDHNSDGVKLTAGNGRLSHFDVRRVSGKSGTGIVQDGAPEWLFEFVKTYAHTDGWSTKLSHLCTYDHCTFAQNTGIGITDVGRSFGCEFVGCNFIQNAYGVNCKSDWNFFGGAIEQNSITDLLVGTTADFQSTYFARAALFGTHMEGESTTPGASKSPMIQIGPSGAAPSGGRIGFLMSGGFLLANSASRKGIEYRNGNSLVVTGVAIKDFWNTSTIITADSNCRGLRFSANDWDGVGTLKSINVSVNNYIDFDTEVGTNYNGASFTHGSAGAKLQGVQEIKSAARSSNLDIISSRNSAAANSLSLKTTGGDNTTLYERISVSSGANVGEVTFPSATVSVPGTYTAPFRIGGSYFWMNGAEFRGKSASAPVSAGDGTLIATI